VAESFNVFGALRSRFPAPEFAYFEEVRNSTGFARVVRTADAIAMGLWPSRGLELHGIEVKVSRSDWLREKEDPAKAEEIQKFCDRWWLAVSDPTIVQDGELPPTWGLLVPRGRRLVAAVEAPKLTPQPVDRSFLAALMRRLHGASPSEKAIAEAVSRARAEEQREFERREKVAEERGNYELRHLREAVAKFEAASGVKIHTFDGAHIGAAVRLVLDGRVDYQRQQLEYLAKQAARIAEHCREVLDKAPQTVPGTEAA
jgi:hypothetical protein